MLSIMSMMKTHKLLTRYFLSCLSGTFVNFTDYFWQKKKIFLSGVAKRYFCVYLHPDNEIVRWCNWQHVWFWSRRVQVRALVGQQENLSQPRDFFVDGWSVEEQGFGKKLKGTVCPLSLYLKGSIMISTSHLEDLITRHLSGTSYFLMGLTVSEDNAIVVILDGDTGVGIDTITDIHRFLEGSLDRDREDFSLEVSSYAADLPLVTPRQYKKYAGRPVEITTNEDLKKEGTLLNIEKESVILQPIIKAKKKGQKPKEGEPLSISFSEIKEIKPGLKF